jgi:phage shock protein A
MTDSPKNTETSQPGEAEVAKSPEAPATPAASNDAQSLGSSGISLPPPDYNQAGVPSLDYVRDKIDARFGRSLGSTELAQETPEARSFEEQAAKREEAARDRLAEIRRSLRGDPPS